MKLEYTTLLEGLDSQVYVNNPDHDQEEEITSLTFIATWVLSINSHQQGIIEAPGIHLRQIHLRYTLENMEEVAEVEAINTDRGQLPIIHRPTRLITYVSNPIDGWELEANLDSWDFKKDGLTIKEAHIDYKDKFVQINF